MRNSPRPHAASLRTPSRQEQAAAEIERRRRELVATSRSLLDFVPHTTPRWQSPRHLGQLVELFERIARGERVRALVSVPPQHGKTELVLHGIAWLLRKKPWLRNGYASYAAKLSLVKSRLARDYAEAAGVELRRDAKAVGQWVTPQGGGLIATGVGGPLTGSPVDGVLVVDDPHKNREEAESATIRAKVQSWWTSTAVTRLHPQASALVVHTRWHEDDLIGWLQTEFKDKWEVIELRAIADELDPCRQPGQALWPEFWTTEALAIRREEVGEYDWASLYDQRPKPKGGTVFGEAHYFTELPNGWRLHIGLDLAYTAKTSSDWSVAVLLAEVGGLYYVIGVHRMQARAPRFAKRLRGLKDLYPEASFFIYAGGTERGTVDMFNEGTPADREDAGEDMETLSGLNIEIFPAVLDKFIRAQRTAAKWNAGKILVPAKDSPFFGPWVAIFVAAIKKFTGLPGGKDDDADAMVAAYDAFAKLIPTHIPEPPPPDDDARWQDDDRGF